MDNRSGRRDREPARYVSEVGTDTVPVKLVELQSVGGRNRSPIPLFLVGVAVAGIVAFALGASLGKGPAPSPTAGEVAAATGTTAPSVATTPSLRPRYTMNLPTVPPTPTPAPTFPWTWARSDLDPGIAVGGLWGVNDRVLLLGRSTVDFDDSFHFRIDRVDEGGTWQSHPVPAAIDELSGGTVVDGKLWFVARVSGVTEDDASWQLVSTETGQTWDAVGATDGLGPVGMASFLRHVRGVWVTSVWGIEGSNPRMLWSNDGRSWHFAEVPEFTGDVEFWHAADINDRLLVLGREFRSFEDVEVFVLTSTDGKTWKRSGAEQLKGRSASELSCSLDECVVPIDANDEDGTEREVLVTNDGLHWSISTLDLPMLDPGMTLRTMQPVGSGFVAMAGYSDFALLSDDGRDWIPVQVIPSDRIEWIDRLAVAGDLVVGFVPSQGPDLPNSIWMGSLTEMHKG